MNTGAPADWSEVPPEVWQSDPRLAYGRGQYEGYRAGYEAGLRAYDAAVVDAMKIAFAGTSDISRADAVSIFLKRVDQEAYRRAEAELHKVSERPRRVASWS